MIKNNKNSRRAGCYWLDSRPYISVTEILRVISKGEALQYWFGKQVYLACSLKPEITEKEALAFPYLQSEKAASRGTTVHSIVEAYKHGQDIQTIPEAYRGYQQAFKSFLAQFNASVVTNETTVINHKEKYAGTLDLILDVDGKKLIVDIKTGKQLYPEHKIQLAAYREALNDQSIVGVAGLLLKEDGGYNFEETINTDQEYKTFLAAKQIYEYLHKEDLVKLGYYR